MRLKLEIRLLVNISNFTHGTIFFIFFNLLLISSFSHFITYTNIAGQNYFQFSRPAV